MQISKRVVIQTHTASAARASAIRASAVRASAIKASAVRVSAARASASTASAVRAAAHYVPRMKGGRFRRGRCACVCQGMGKKENEIQSNQPSLTFLNRTIPKSHSKIFENDWLDWIGWFKLKLKNG
jgi:hypothetical protein